MKHIGIIISKEEVLKNRSSKYKFINFNKMTNVEKIKRAEMLIREVLIDEQENFNGNDSVLASIELDVLYHIVNHWYTVRESSIFQNEEGIEIDEYLCVEEIILD